LRTGGNIATPAYTVGGERIEAGENRSLKNSKSSRFNSQYFKEAFLSVFAAIRINPARKSCVNDVKKGGVFDEKGAVDKV
jgi:hypothetical protein